MGSSYRRTAKELWVTSLADSGVYVYDVATNHFSTEIPSGNAPTGSPFRRMVATVL